MVKNSCHALIQTIYTRAFDWILDKCNEQLNIRKVKKYSIGLLDIVGFETFEENGFEQLCINFANERIQQFFNNFMFVLEQEEYIREEIVWESICFDLNSQAVIDFIEKPIGLFSMLEEECLLPNGSDEIYKQKLYTKFLDKNICFGKQTSSKLETHFDIHHYAGKVSYSINDWLEKNKNSLNELVVDMFKAQQRNPLLSFLFNDFHVDSSAEQNKKLPDLVTTKQRVTIK